MTALQFEGIKEKQQRMWASGTSRRWPLASTRWPSACARPRTSTRALDVATGSGNAAIAAARYGCEVVGIDYVPALLEWAHERARAEGLEVELIEADAEAAVR
jgi:ubiquinone/menaquinone biosynthesis C-methylase UbiE